MRMSCEIISKRNTCFEEPKLEAKTSIALYWTGILFMQKLSNNLILINLVSTKKGKP